MTVSHERLVSWTIEELPRNEQSNRPHVLPHQNFRSLHFLLSPLDAAATLGVLLTSGQLMRHMGMEIISTGARSKCNIPVAEQKSNQYRQGMWFMTSHMLWSCQVEASPLYPKRNLLEVGPEVSYPLLNPIHWFARKSTSTMCYRSCWVLEPVPMAVEKPISECTVNSTSKALASN